MNPLLAEWRKQADDLTNEQREQAAYHLLGALTYLISEHGDAALTLSAARAIEDAAEHGRARPVPALS